MQLGSRGGLRSLLAAGGHRARKTGQFGHQIGLQQRDQGLVQRGHFQGQQRLVQARHAAAVQRVAEQIPAMILVRP